MPQTVRTDIRFRLPSDPLFRPIATRHYGYVELKDQSFPANTLGCWYYYDLVATDIYQVSGDSGIMDAGLRVRRDIQWLPELPVFLANNGVSRSGIRVEEYVSAHAEPESYRLWEYPDRTTSGAQTFRFVYDRSQPIVTDFGWPQPANITLSAMPAEPLVGGNYPLRWATWYPVSEAYDLSPYEP
jgi:hypothetical protein